MLVNEIETLRKSGVIDRIIVVSPDPEVLKIVEAHGATGLIQASGGLNEALRLAREVGQRFDTDREVVLLGDLPFLSASDVRTMVGAVEPGRVVLAPDRRDEGTNAMASEIADEMPFAFGNGSLTAHRRLAAERGLDVHEIRSFGLGFDLDTTGDLAEYECMLVASEE